jgi:hypothetical protein
MAYFLNIPLIMMAMISRNRGSSTRATREMPGPAPLGALGPAGAAEGLATTGAESPPCAHGEEGVRPGTWRKWRHAHAWAEEAARRWHPCPGLHARPLEPRRALSLTSNLPIKYLSSKALALFEWPISSKSWVASFPAGHSGTGVQ